MQPKIENSPSPNRPYDQILHRQTVLMWGTNHHHHNDPNASPSNTRSPCQTPKSFGTVYSSNASINTPLTHSDKSNKSIESQHTSNHLKWNGNSSTTGNSNNNKDVVSIFPIHHGNNEVSTPYSPTASSNSIHSIDSRYSNHNRHGEMTNCEVWPSSSYSQYQYFPYHHVSNAHHQHPTSTQWVFNFWFMYVLFIFFFSFAIPRFLS